MLAWDDLVSDRLGGLANTVTRAQASSKLLRTKGMSMHTHMYMCNHSTTSANLNRKEKTQIQYQDPSRTSRPDPREGNR